MLLLLAIALLAQLAGRLRIPYPVFLVLGGLAIALIPGIPDLRLEPDVVFLVFLPPLLYAAAFTASPRDLKANAGRIALLAIALVMLTVVAVAAVARVVLGDELSWPMAFVLGAVLAPTHPVAATSVFRRTPVPERVAVVVEGESLVNDGVGLTLYRGAVGAATAGTFSLFATALQTLAVAIGGAAIGLAVGWGLVQLKRRVQEPEIEITLSLFTPYAAYIAAETAGASGVLAAVAVGLYSGWRRDVFLPETRVKIQAFWGALAFLLDSVLFVLVGLQLPTVLDALSPRPLGRYVLPALGVAIAVMAVRMAFVLALAFIRARLPDLVEEPLPRGERVVVGWSGMRGAVSLAAALAVPLEASGRDVVLLVTFATILVTLVVQGLTLPLLVRACGLERSAGDQRQEQEARLQAAEAALHRLDQA